MVFRIVASIITSDFHLRYFLLRVLLFRFLIQFLLLQRPFLWLLLLLLLMQYKYFFSQGEKRYKMKKNRERKLHYPEIQAVFKLTHTQIHFNNQPD